LILQRHFVVPLNEDMELSPAGTGFPAELTACEHYSGKMGNLQYYSLLNCKFKYDNPANLQDGKA